MKIMQEEVGDSSPYHGSNIELVTVIFSPLFISFTKSLPLLLLDTFLSPWHDLASVKHDSSTIHVVISFCRQNETIQEESDEFAEEEDSEYDVTDEEEDSEPVR